MDDSKGGGGLCGRQHRHVYTACARNELNTCALAVAARSRLRAGWIDAWPEQHARGSAL